MNHMGRRKDELKLTSHESEALKRLSRRSRSSPHHAFRAKIVLHCAAGLTNIEVATKMRTTRLTVGKWRSRFVAQRMEGLYDEPRPGASRKIGDDQIEEVVTKTLETTPKGRTHWSTRSMAKHLGLSHSTIGRIWRTFGLQPHRSESFRLLARPTTCRKGARRCWPVHEPTGQRGRPVRRREISDSSARTRPTRFADELGPARASDS